MVSVARPRHNRKPSPPPRKGSAAQWTSSPNCPTERRSYSASGGRLIDRFVLQLVSVQRRRLRDMWNGSGVLAGLLLIALMVWQALRLANINVEIGVTPAMITAALSVLLLIASPPLARQTGSSIDNEGSDARSGRGSGYILAIVIVVGAWLNMQAAGEGLAEIRSQVRAAAAHRRGEGSRSTATTSRLRPLRPRPHPWSRHRCGPARPLPIARRSGRRPTAGSPRGRSDRCRRAPPPAVGGGAR